MEGNPVPRVVRRYLIHSDDPNITEALKKSFSNPPHRCFPHGSGNPDMFYIEVGGSILRAKQFIVAIRYKLIKYGIANEVVDQLEIIEEKKEN